MTEPATVGSQRPRRRDAVRNRERLIGAAQAVFAEAGLGGSLEEVARRAGVSIGTLYNHFPTRDALIDAAIAEQIESSTRLAERALARSDPWAALTEHLAAMVQRSLADRGFHEACAYTLASDSAAERAKRRGHELIDELVRRAQRAGALRADVATTDLTLLVWAVVGAAAPLRAAEPDAWRRVLAVMLDGLRAGEAVPPAGRRLPGRPLDPAAIAEAMRFSAPTRRGSAGAASSGPAGERESSRSDR